MKYICIKPHCGVCYTLHPCVKTKAFAELSAEAKSEAILKDSLISLSLEVLKTSGVKSLTSDEMLVWSKQMQGGENNDSY